MAYPPAPDEAPAARPSSSRSREAAWAVVWDAEHIDDRELAPRAPVRRGREESSSSSTMVLAIRRTVRSTRGGDSTRAGLQEAPSEASGIGTGMTTWKPGLMGVGEGRLGPAGGVGAASGELVNPPDRAR